MLDPTETLELERRCRELADRAPAFITRNSVTKELAIDDVVLRLVQFHQNLPGIGHLSLFVMGKEVFTETYYESGAYRWQGNPDKRAHALRVLRNHMILQDLAEI